MSQIGYIPGQKKKEKKDLKILSRLKKFGKKILSGKPNSNMSRLGALPGSEKDSPYKTLSKKFNNKSTKKTYNKKKPTPAQLLARKRIGKGTAKNPDTTIAQVKAKNEKSMRDAARKRNEKFKKTGKSTIEERRAKAKKAMQDAARKRNADFQRKRKLKIKNKKK
ncbi:MAG: hypothetical protein CMC78_02465 [Flavobacteriaceae bacterium]|nr:hypothetical protein [Flavobacteriaceae bacterium]|tara:strand:- start:1651 stop:2145 length:495 start_codon:yes stop_codon:yes gene_type:complete